MIDSHRRSRTTASPGARVEAWSSGKQVCGRNRKERGQTAVELALAVPVLLTLITGVVVFGIAFNNNIALTFATENATQLLSISRGQTTDPCQTISQAVYSAAPNLDKSTIKFTIVLNGNAATTNASTPSCSGHQSDLVQSSTAKVTATYPSNLQIFGVNPAPNCNLTANTTILVQ